MIYDYDLKKNNKLTRTKNSQIHLKSTKQFDLYTNSSFTDFINNLNNDFLSSERPMKTCTLFCLCVKRPFDLWRTLVLGSFILNIAQTLTTDNECPSHNNDEPNRA